MYKDKIVEQVRKVRESFAKRHDYDVRKIANALDERDILAEYRLTKTIKHKAKAD